MWYINSGKWKCVSWGHPRLLYDAVGIHQRSIHLDGSFKRDLPPQPRLVRQISPPKVHVHSILLPYLFRKVSSVKLGASQGKQWPERPIAKGHRIRGLCKRIAHRPSFLCVAHATLWTCTEKKSQKGSHFWCCISRRWFYFIHSFFRSNLRPSFIF